MLNAHFFCWVTSGDRDILGISPAVSNNLDASEVSLSLSGCGGGGGGAVICFITTLLSGADISGADTVPEG